MSIIAERIAALNWPEIAGEMHAKGYAILPKILSNRECAGLKAHYKNPLAFRKTVVMERYRFGLGEYKYYNYPLPGIIQEIRKCIYPELAGIANKWMKVLNTGTTFPESHESLLALCNEHAQVKPTPLILKYGQGGFNTLHQDLYGEIYFPLQTVLFLSEPQQDYTGGEFVITEQIPRAQSKAIVLQPEQGDLLIFTTNFRPVKGNRGYYRVTMKHGVSEVQSGERYTLGIIFHDALS